MILFKGDFCYRDAFCDIGSPGKGGGERSFGSWLTEDLITRLRKPHDKYSLNPHPAHEECLSLQASQVTPELNLAALESGVHLSWIMNPDEELLLSVLKKDGLKINDDAFKDASSLLRKAALENNGLAIEFIGNPTEEEKLIAVSQHARSIALIKEPSVEVQVAAMIQDRIDAVDREERCSSSLYKDISSHIAYIIDEPCAELVADARKRNGCTLYHKDLFFEVKI